MYKTLTSLATPHLDSDRQPQMRQADDIHRLQNFRSIFNPDGCLDHRVHKIKFTLQLPK